MMEAFTRRSEAGKQHIFDQMFRQRYDIYVKRRKWRALNSNNDKEIDGYDTNRARYLLAIDDADRVLAGLRLLPTNGPHILGDLFPDLVENGETPRGHDVLELTRFYIAPFGAGRALQDWLIGILCSGMFEYCLERKIKKVTSVIDAFLVPLMKSMEWPVKALGKPRRYREGIAVAVEVDVSGAVLRSTRRTMGVPGPVLSRRGARLSRLPRSIMDEAMLPRSGIIWREAPPVARHGLLRSAHRPASADGASLYEGRSPIAVR